MRRLLTVFALTTLVACSGLTGETDPRIEGTWTGASNGQSITMSLIQSGEVTGIATITGGAGASRSFGVTGTFRSSAVRLSFAGPTPADTMNFTGTVAAKTMAGTLNGAGFSASAVSFTRQ